MRTHKRLSHENAPDPARSSAIVLPFTRERQEQRPARAAADHGSGIVPGRGARIVIVEDEYLVALELESGLVEAGYEVVGAAATADEAVRLAQRERPSLLIMDIRLRGQRDGIDAAIEIYRTTGIRCVFATAHSDAHTRARAEPASPLGWVAKPYLADHVVSAVRRALDSLATDG